MRRVIIVNPSAGRHNCAPKIMEAARSAFGDNGFSLLISQEPGDCCRFARGAGESGEETMLYACGGDGTLNEVISGAAGYDNLSVTTVPFGSGNDFVKHFHHPERFRDFCSFEDAEERRLDVMSVNDRYALNICSMGLDARIGTDINAFRHMPLLHGQRAYHASVVVNVLRGIARPCQVEIDGEIVADGPQTMVCICNGSWYGGSYHPVPEADMQDGKLDVLVVKKVSRLTVARVVSAYQKGEYRNYPDLIHPFRARCVRIRAPKPESVNLDGELMMSDDVTVTVRPQSLRFFAPKASWKTPGQNRDRNQSWLSTGGTYMEFQKLMEARRSVRAYDGTRRVTEEQLREMVQAALQAPSWKNSQTARYYAILDPKRAAEFAAVCLPESNAGKSAGAALVVTTFVRDCAGFDREGKPDNEVGNGWGFYDLGLQNMNFLLRARELGLDTLVMGIRDGKAIRSYLSVPDSETIAAVIAVGYGAAEPANPKRKTTEGVLHLF